jgi:hypothetical protein
MPTPADRLNEDDPQPPRHSEESHHTPDTLERHIQSNTFKKERDDNATIAWTSPRVSPVREGGWRKGTPEALKEGMAAPAGVTASVPNKPTGISADP